MLFKICLIGIILIKIDIINSIFLFEKPQEVQHATCNIITKEIEAKAKATVTRDLKGVCSSGHFKQFEKHIIQQFDEIKSILKENGFKMPEKNRIEETFFDDYEEPSVSLKNLETDQNINNNKLYIDIAMFNDTIVQSEEGDIYYYYWKIENVKELMEKNNIYISSPNFSALGHLIHIQFFPNYEEHFGFQLKPNSSGFIKKHKFTIINQNNYESEISSKILTGLDTDNKIFKIYFPTIISGDFIDNNSVLIRLMLYLNS